jgi:5'-nucleotidase / UDP-sugar diphosphatase
MKCPPTSIPSPLDGSRLANTLNPRGHADVTPAALTTPRSGAGQAGPRNSRSKAGTQRRVRRLFGAALMASAAAMGLGVSGGCGGTREPLLTSPCPPNTPCSIKMTFLHTSDIHSRLLPYEQLITQVDADLGLGGLNEVANIGGIARMAYIIGRERARADRVLHLDSGDCFQGAPIFNFFSGEPEVRALSALGIDAAVLGNHEYDKGSNNVATQFQKWSNFSLLAANYKWEDITVPNYAQVGSIARPYQVFNQEGLKVAVIGMGNLSSLTSVFDQPNRLSITPMSTIDVAQFYVDLLRPHVDLVVMVTHLGLDVDQRMVRGTTGIDLVMGGHNHVVISPPQEIRDCSIEGTEGGFVWVGDPNAKITSADQTPPDDAAPELKGSKGALDPIFHPFMIKRACKPRKVMIAHSGAFAKYVGRLDLVLSNDPAEVSPTGVAADYDPINKFELTSSRYVAYPVVDSTPEDPVVKEMLLPYQRQLGQVADLDILLGYSPEGAKRTASNGGDSPLGNLVATAMWLRLGIQTDFSLTNSAGIRADLLPGPVTTEQMYNIFPFDNSVSKMQLSGLEVQQMFDFVARRSSGRACTSQVQIAGARVRVNCAGCKRPNANEPCVEDTDCKFSGSCNKDTKTCKADTCAEQVYVGYSRGANGKVIACTSDEACAFGGPVNPGQCDKNLGRCQALINDINRYELATSNYLASGGSGFRVLQRNTTQFDTKIQQRDALIDYVRQGRACGYAEGPNRTNGLANCTVDKDCAGEAGDFVCACPSRSKATVQGDKLTCQTEGQCGPGAGQCVRRDCRDQVATFHDRKCLDSPTREACIANLGPCTIGGESCKILACVDPKIGSISDGRLEMLGR